MSTEEYTGRYLDGWASKRFVATLRNITKETSLIIHGQRYQWPEQLTISIYIDGELVEQAEIQEGYFTIQTTIKPLIKSRLEIISSSVFVPKEIGLNEDVRNLSFLLTDIIIPDMPDLMEPYNHLFDFNSSRTVYFMDEEVWDHVSLLLADTYKIPDKAMLHPLTDKLWWDKADSSLPSSIRGTVYDKFSGEPLQVGKVHIISSGSKLVMESSIDSKGYYEIGVLPFGEYGVVVKSNQYGDQAIKVHVDSFCKTIHVPMLPLN